MISSSGRLIGFFGFPRRKLFRQAREKYGFDSEFVDLDIDMGAPDAGILPSTTCRIITNVVNNAVFLSGRLEVILGAVGEGKCDRGRHTAYILRERGMEVLESRFPREEYEDRPLIYSCGRMPLKEKIERIMDTIVKPEHLQAPPSCEPTHGFWGVPPNDMRILDLFPPTTHVYGWTRCVEAGRPSDTALECYVDQGVPTVFFNQTFCAKQDLAYYLAEKYDGMAIDCHDKVNDSILAKVEAFVRLS
jgi:hypothetical protein